MARNEVGDPSEAEKVDEAVRYIRRPLPPFAKAIRRVAKALDHGVEEEVTAEGVEMLGSEQALALAVQVEESLARLERLKKSPAGALGDDPIG